MTDASEARDDMSPDLTAHYRQVLDTHRPEGKRRACSVCNVARCPDWLDAYDKLAGAGQLMATPDRWQSQLSKGCHGVDDPNVTVTRPGSREERDGDRRAAYPLHLPPCLPQYDRT